MSSIVLPSNNDNSAESATSNVALPSEISQLRDVVTLEKVDTSVKKSASSRRRSKRELRRKNLHKYLSTSTVVVTSTITNQDFNQVTYCIGAVLQAQMFDDLFDTEISTDIPPEFIVDTGLSPENGGPTTEIPAYILDFETNNDEELREAILYSEVPTIDTIYRFIVYVYGQVRCSIECNILALIYVNRMTQRKNLALTMESWRGFWISALNLAQKIWDDKAMRTSDLAAKFPSMTKEQMRTLELSGFRMLDFVTRVKPSTYAKYYFELRSLYCDIVGAEYFETWNIEELSEAGKQRLKYRTSLPGTNRSEDVHGYKATSSQAYHLHSPEVKLLPLVSRTQSISANNTPPRGSRTSSMTPPPLPPSHHHHHHHPSSLTAPSSVASSFSLPSSLTFTNSAATTGSASATTFSSVSYSNNNDNSNVSGLSSVMSSVTNSVANSVMNSVSVSHNQEENLPTVESSAAVSAVSVSSVSSMTNPNNQHSIASPGPSSVSSSSALSSVSYSSTSSSQLPLGRLKTKKTVYSKTLEDLEPLGRVARVVIN